MLSIELVLGKERIKSSIESAKDVLRTLIDIVARTSSPKQLVEVVTDYVQNVIKLRPTSALLVNTFRDILSQLLELLERRIELETAVSELKNYIEKLINNIEESLDRAAKIASRRIVDGDRIMTLSFSMGVIKALSYALQEGKRFEVYVLESRPGNEGVELAKRLSSMGIPTTLIVDSAARFYMKTMTKVLIGAEAVAANGAVVNKVGTSIVALAANEARVRVFVVAPTNKFSFETIHGELIELPTLEPAAILPRDLQELGVKAYAPLFDVTPPEYIDAIATERGFIAPQAVPFLLREVYGSWPPRVPDIFTLAKRLHEVVS